MSADHGRVMELFGSVFNDVAGSVAIMMSYLGDQTGVYRAMDKLGPATASSIAIESQVDERYLLEWLSSNAARGYVTYDDDISYSVYRLSRRICKRKRADVHSRFNTGSCWTICKPGHHNRCL